MKQGRLAEQTTRTRAPDATETLTGSGCWCNGRGRGNCVILVLVSTHECAASLLVSAAEFKPMTAAFTGCYCTTWIITLPCLRQCGNRAIYFQGALRNNVRSTPSINLLQQHLSETSPCLYTLCLPRRPPTMPCI